MNWLHNAPACSPLQVCPEDIIEMAVDVIGHAIY